MKMVAAGKTKDLIAMPVGLRDTCRRLNTMSNLFDLCRMSDMVLAKQKSRTSDLELREDTRRTPLLATVQISFQGLRHSIAIRLVERTKGSIFEVIRRQGKRDRTHHMKSITVG